MNNTESSHHLNEMGKHFDELNKGAVKAKQEIQASNLIGKVRELELKVEKLEEKNRALEKAVKNVLESQAKDLREKIKKLEGK